MKRHTILGSLFCTALTLGLSGCDWGCSNKSDKDKKDKDKTEEKAKKDDKDHKSESILDKAKDEAKDVVKKGEDEVKKGADEVKKGTECAIEDVKDATGIDSKPKVSSEQEVVDQFTPPGSLETELFEKLIKDSKTPQEMVDTCVMIYKSITDDATKESAEALLGKLKEKISSLPVEEQAAFDKLMLDTPEVGELEKALAEKNLAPKF